MLLDTLREMVENQRRWEGGGAMADVIMWVCGEPYTLQKGFEGVEGVAGGQISCGVVDVIGIGWWSASEARHEERRGLKEE